MTRSYTHELNAKTLIIALFVHLCPPHNQCQSLCCTVARLS